MLLGRMQTAPVISATSRDLVCPPTSTRATMRMKGNDVLMVSGTDEHGTPILVEAEKEGLSCPANWPTVTTA